jgi:TPR repeat protein
VIPPQVGRYVVLRELSRGAYGLVYEAQDPSGARVALKLLIQGRGADPATLLRFQREARALVKVCHPNVVTVRDVGEHEGVPYLALDYHSGGSLRDVIDRARLSPARVAEIGIQMAEGLAAAHAEGVLHRDLKPGNVLLDEEGRVFLADFGLAKDLDRIGHTQALTQSGTVQGTPGYWSPEQAAGLASEIGPATDVYSLGATLYSALARRPPVTGKNLVEIAQATSEHRIPHLRALAPEVPRRLARVIMQCLEREPASRPASAADVAIALRRSQQGAARPLAWASAGVLLIGALGLGLFARWAPPGAATPSPALGTSPASPSASPAPLDPQVLWERAEAADTREDYEEAARLLRRGAEQGDVLCMARLARYLIKGRQGVKRDTAQAVLLLERASKLGHLPATHELSGLYLEGVEVDRDKGRAFALARDAAEAGLVVAMQRVAGLYLAGQGVEEDREAAETWFRRAADAGSTSAMVAIARTLLPPDSDEGMALLLRAADLGNTSAMERLGTVALHRGDMVEATSWYRRGAEAGDLECAYCVALSFARGRGVEQDLLASERLYLANAERGHGKSMINLAVSYLKGTTGPKRPAQAMPWLLRAAALEDPAVAAKARDILAQITVSTGPDDPAEMFEEGRRLFRGEGVPQDVDQGVKWISRSGSLGHVDAIAYLAMILSTGAEGVKQEPERAAKLRALAAEKGHVDAMFNVAWGLAEAGRSEEAAVYYRRGAEKGDPRSMLRLGIQCQKGEGAPTDLSKAADWFRLSAEAGNAEAAIRLADCYLEGSGVEIDRDQAKLLLQRAAKSRDPESRALAGRKLTELGEGKD